MYFGRILMEFPYFEELFKCLTSSLSMSHKEEDIQLLKDKLIALLHPKEREFMTNVNMDPYLKEFTFPSGIFTGEYIDITGCIGIVVSGIIGVKHDFNGLDSITHFYQKGDLLLSIEIEEAFNKQGSFWQFYDNTRILLLPLKDDKWQQSHPHLSSVLLVQASLMATYMYQEHINNLGLDCKYFSVNWLKENYGLLQKVPRMDIANYLDISKSSLKSFMKIALTHG
tara:strand:- start:168 stop:845 length:678 start_codon:yes stop_codon:yes gene_type:complete